MALILGSNPNFSLLCGNIYTNIPKIIIDVIVILIHITSKSYHACFGMRLIFASSHIGLVNFFDTIINVRLDTMVPTWCPPNITKK
jgi:succinate dehydrogenase/fumarate reductase cytochrome b subunit